MKFEFWYCWLLLSSMLFACIGVYIALFPDGIALSPWNNEMARHFFDGDAPEDAAKLKSFLFGPLGGTILGFYFLQIYIIWNAFRQKKRWAWWAILAGTLSWFAIDNLQSIKHGAWFNVLLINFPAIVVVGLPLVMTWREFFSVPKGSGAWQFDEFKPVGRDYGSQSEVDVYDSSHADFRDIVAESHHVLDTLGIKPGDTVIDFGSGTGTFAVEAAKREAKVHAVDVSQAMLARAKAKANQEGVSGIEFHHAGFLTYEHPEDSVDAVVTIYAFHHLPDFWKGIALKRIHRMLKPGGVFYLHDVVIQEPSALDNIARFVDNQEKAGGDFLREDAEGHFRDEFSTYDWVIDEMLSRAGFSVTSKHMEDGVLGTYLCIKKQKSPPDADGKE